MINKNINNIIIARRNSAPLAQLDRVAGFEPEGCEFESCMVHQIIMEFILAQIFGIIALILICIGYFLKTKSRFMIIQIIANIFYASAFFVVEAYVGAVITSISIFRCIYLYFAEKKSFKYKFHFLPIFIALYITVTIVFWASPFDIMPLISSTIFTLAYTLKDMQRMRFILIIPNVILIAYNIFTTTYASALLDLLEFIVIIVSIIKFHIQNKKNNKIENL